MLATAVAGLVANWLRVASLIVIGHVTHMQHYLIRVDHLYYGWALFMLTMVPVFLLARRLESRDAATGTVRVSGQSVPQWIPRWSAAILWTAVALAYASILVLAIRERSHRCRKPRRHRQYRRSSRQRGSQPLHRAGNRSFPVRTEYRQEWKSDGVVEIYTARYPRQSRDARLSLPVNSITGRSLQVTSTSVVDGHVEIRGVLAGRERLLWTWYVAAGRTAYSKPSLRTAELLGLLSGRRDGWVTALQTECQGDCDRARERLLQCSKSGPALDQMPL